MKSTLLLVVLCVLDMTFGYPRGAPAQIPGVCEDMTPRHGGTIQSSPSPYSINVMKKCYKPGDHILVEINGNGNMFRGFFVQARSGGSMDNSYGMFMINGPGQKLLSCFGGMNNSISHSDNNDRANTNLHWVAKYTSEQDITFNVTIVQNTATYWVGLVSETIRYDAWCNTAPPKPPVMGAGAQPTFSYILLIAMTTLALLAYK